MNPKTALKFLFGLALCIATGLSFLYLQEKNNSKPAEDSPSVQEEKKLTPEEKEIKRIDEEIEDIWENNKNENGGLDSSKLQEVEDLTNEKIYIQTGGITADERRALRAEREAKEAEVNALIDNSE